MTETSTEPASTTETSTIESPTTVKSPGPDQARSRVVRRGRWPFLLLILAVAWIALIRVPLILNARAHLDSDLAVDGITLREALKGHWRWHYPATPHIGILPVFYSMPQALIWGATPSTLVSGGTVVYAGLAMATFALGWVAFGRSVALWGLLPLTFSSTGAIWLSGRITGGHLSAALWHAVAFLLFYLALARGGRKLVIALGVWCGLGIYVDSMFLLTLAGLVPAAIGYWLQAGRPRHGLLMAALFGLALLVGAAPREIGRRVDPHNAYPMHFLTQPDAKVLLTHLRLLGLDCLPRLITGHRLPDLQSAPFPSSLGGPGSNNAPRDTSPLAIAVTVVLLVIFLASVRALADPGSIRNNRATNSVRWALVISAVANLVAFVFYQDIFDSDNYRYLVTLLVPWSIGFGLAMGAIVRLGRAGIVVAALCGATMAGLMTLDTGRWYHQFGWIDSDGRPIRVAVSDPALDWLNAHPEIHSFLSGYWDAYKWTFAADRPVLGVPYPMYPNRFPEWSAQMPGEHPQVVISRRFPSGGPLFDPARAQGGELLARGPRFFVFSWPQSNDETSRDTSADR